MNSTFPFEVRLFGEMYYVINADTRRVTQRCYREYDAKRIAEWLYERHLGYLTRIELRS